ncbi:MAG: ABC-F type ribosomal protection protein [Clostridia bacterium]|nr:ABC-F type ribosomal protection protein [Clostridia bacterium]
MQINIKDGTVDLSGEPILRNLNFEINTESRIGVVGRNGCGKTTLLRLLAGELKLAPTDTPEDNRFVVSGHPVIKMQSQMAFSDNSVLMVDEVRSAYSEILSMKARLDELTLIMEKGENDDAILEYTTLLDRFTNAGGFYFEKEYDAAIRSFGFTDEDKQKPLSDFSGGQRTKIAFLKLLLSKPDLLLLDEPTNHLDLDAVMWLEEYLKNYKKAFVVVSHDRMFLDRTVNTIYEIERGRCTRYNGNYTEFTVQKKLNREQRAKEYAAQQREIEHLENLVERFRYKATKAAMAQSKLKQLERIERIDAPEKDDVRTFHAVLSPSLRSARDVLSVKELEIGYDKPLCKVSFEVRRGERIGIIGGNGLGKSTLLKTLVGRVQKLGGDFYFGGATKVGYFDQQLAELTGNQTVLENFQTAFPNITDFEARSKLGAFLFTQEDVFKTLSMLSGGEKVRLSLCKLFAEQPNVLILDEPTNHMDIIGKETLEEILSEFEGTLIFVSHDRYFVKKLSQKLLVLKNDGCEFYEYGYEQYESANVKKEEKPALTEKTEPKQKKNYTTPAKERSRCERALAKAEEKIALLELKIGGLEDEMQTPEIASDYLKLSEAQKELEALQTELSVAMSEWEAAAERLEELNV